jgi:transcriptional regulator with XRE-family HTH domain
MNEIQTKLTELQEKGWTLAAIADELEVTVNAVEKWKAGARQPRNSKAVFLLLNQLMKKRVPKKKRYNLRYRNNLQSG